MNCNLYFPMVRFERGGPEMTQYSQPCMADKETNLINISLPCGVMQREAKQGTDNINMVQVYLGLGYVCSFDSHYLATLKYRGGGGSPKG